MFHPSHHSASRPGTRHIAPEGCIPYAPVRERQGCGQLQRGYGDRKVRVGRVVRPANTSDPKPSRFDTFTVYNKVGRFSVAHGQLSETSKRHPAVQSLTLA